MSKNIRGYMYVLLILSGVIILSLLLIGLGHNNKTKITSDSQMLVVLGDSSVPIPQWEKDVMYKYDDWFIAPSIIIQFENGIQLDLSTSDYQVAQEQWVQAKKIGNINVDVYRDERKLSYIFRDKVSYLFSMREEKQIDLVEQFIRGL